MHALGDALSSGLVLCAGLVIRWQQDADGPSRWTDYVDPAVTVVLCVGMASSMASVLRRACHILMESSIPQSELDEIRGSVAQMIGVCHIHELVVTELDFERLRRASVKITCSSWSLAPMLREAIARRLHRAGARFCTVEIAAADAAGEP